MQQSVAQQNNDSDEPVLPLEVQYRCLLRLFKQITWKNTVFHVCRSTCLCLASGLLEVSRLLAYHLSASSSLWNSVSGLHSSTFCPETLTTSANGLQALNDLCRLAKCHKNNASAGHRAHCTWTVSYLRDLLCDVVCPVNEFAGCYDVHLPRGQSNEWVRFEIHKIECDLRDFGNGAVPHEVRVWRGVQYVQLAVYCTWKYANEVQQSGKKTSRKTFDPTCASSPVLLLASRMLGRRFFRSHSGLMASISSTEEARRMLWKLSRERLCDREQLEAEPSGLRLSRWWGATQGVEWVRGPTRWAPWVWCGGTATGGSEHNKVRWSSWRSSGQLCSADLGNTNNEYFQIRDTPVSW